MVPRQTRPTYPRCGESIYSAVGVTVHRDPNGTLEKPADQGAMLARGELVALAESWSLSL